MKVVINVDFGGFGISNEAYETFYKLTGLNIYIGEIDRTDKILVKIVETMGSKSWGEGSRLHVVDVPHRYWIIDSYDGNECIYASDSVIDILR